MSSARLEWRIAVRESDLDPAAKLLAYTLDTFMNRGGVCWPSRASLASAAGCTVRTVERTTTRLEEAGLIAVVRTRGRRSNRYVQLIPNGDTGDAVELSPTAYRETTNGDTGVARSTTEVGKNKNRRSHANVKNEKPELLNQLLEPAEFLSRARGWVHDRQLPA